jgi:hypothetical protein
VSLPDSTASVSLSEQATWGFCMHGPAPGLELIVAVVGLMSRLPSWTCHCPRKRALAAAGAAVELLAPEDIPGLGFGGPPVVQEAPPDVGFEHHAATTATITVATMATIAADLPPRCNNVPDFRTDAIMG